MPSVILDSAEIWYDDRGSGEVALLVHGGLFDPMDGERFWLRPGVADALVAAGYRVLTPDRRFCSGRTQSDFRVHSWQVEAADLGAVVMHAGVSRAHVLAGSNGCSAAIHLALAWPEVVTSLLLCWPTAPENAALEVGFERSAQEIERIGTSAYLATLRERGVSRPEETHCGFPFGVALLRDARAARTFLATPARDARGVVRETASMLPGTPVRGVVPSDLQQLARHVRTVRVLPAEPEDAFHLRSTALALAEAIPGAELLPGLPVAPSPLFPAARQQFIDPALATFER